MTRYRGTIGINRGLRETSPGIYVTDIYEMIVSGEMRTQQAGWSDHNINETVKARHIFSMVTPESTDIDLNEVVYIEWKGRKWTITSIQYKRPRVELTLGGLYNAK